MNIEEYISSGILEAYVLGDLSISERVEVEKNLSLYPQLREELRAIEETQETLLMKAAIQPRAAVRNAIFDQLRIAGVQQEQSAPTVPFHSSTPESEHVIPLTRWKFAAAASITIAIISSFLAYNYWQKWRASSADLIALQQQSERIAEDYNRVNQKLDKIGQDLRVMQSSAFTRVIMSGTPNAPGSTASVFWNPSTSELFLQVENMKKLTADQQYQLWAIIDGKPVDAGVFDVSESGLIKMKPIGEGAATFAVTIEPRGGKESPTLETMQVAGNVAKG